MADQYGSDFITILDDEGTEYELEVLSELEYNGASYIAAIPTSEELAPEILIFKVTEEDGENILAFLEDEEELEAVNSLLIESLYDSSES